MLARRIIPCLDVKDGRVVKGVRFRDHETMGDAAELAARYRDQGADELVFYDIAASAENRTLDYSWVREIAQVLDVPFCVAGGVRSVADAMRCLENGADKVSINSPALERPELITEIAERTGSQCVVVGVDSCGSDGGWRVNQYSGDAARSRELGVATLDWIVEAQSRGAGEIVLNCMNRDGVRQGYDIAQLAAARARLTIPLIASGGAGAAAHFVELFRKTDASGALAASVFHKGLLTVGAVKNALAAAGIEVRL
ncbi:MAG TPA: imidazole glycerol phosphate synthase subunit HisF [Rhizomicrobium sp.]